LFKLKGPFLNRCLAPFYTGVDTSRTTNARRHQRCMNYNHFSPTPLV
jgi:hypothetical protein